MSVRMRSALKMRLVRVGAVEPAAFSARFVTSVSIAITRVVDGAASALGVGPDTAGGAAGSAQLSATKTPTSGMSRATPPRSGSQRASRLVVALRANAVGRAAGALRLLLDQLVNEPREVEIAEGARVPEGDWVDRARLLVPHAA